MCCREGSLRPGGVGESDSDSGETFIATDDERGTWTPFPVATYQVESMSAPSHHCGLLDVRPIGQQDTSGDVKVVRGVSFSDDMDEGRGAVPADVELTLCLEHSHRSLSCLRCNITKFLTFQKAHEFFATGDKWLLVFNACPHLVASRVAAHLSGRTAMLESGGGDGGMWGVFGSAGTCFPTIERQLAAYVDAAIITAPAAVAAVVLLERADLELSRWTCHRLVETAMILSMKFIEDDTYSLKYFSDISKTSVLRLRQQELTMLKRLGWNAQVRPNDFLHVCDLLRLGRLFIPRSMCS